MKSSAKKVELAPYDDLFSTEESRQDAKLEKVREAVMLWDAAAQDWSDVVCCPTPESMFNKLLESATAYKEYLILRKRHLEVLDAEGEKTIAYIRQHYLELKGAMA